MLATSMGHWHWIPLGTLGQHLQCTQDCPPKGKMEKWIPSGSHNSVVQGFPVECYVHLPMPKSGLHMHKCQVLPQASRINE